jgi:two-component system, chemotaxis family, sensor kinase CheA
MPEYDIDPEVLAGFIDESQEGLKVVENLFVELEQDPGNNKIIQEIFRPVHSLKGTCAFFGLHHTKELSHAMENVLDDVRQGRSTVNKQMISLLLEGIDMLIKIFDRLSQGEDEITDEDAFRKMVDSFSQSFDDQKLSTLDLHMETAVTIMGRIEEVKFLLPDKLSGLSDEIQALLEKIFGTKEHLAVQLEQLKSKKQIKKEKADTSDKITVKKRTKKPEHHERKVDKTMRVPEKSIDTFIDYLGELVIVEEMFLYLQKKVADMGQSGKVSADFKRVIETFSSLSDNLIKNILEIRSVAASGLLNKSARIVRDICSKNGKTARVRIKGEQIRIDKSYVELLDAPLTHLVRNAIDHGIEEPETRKKSGKPEVGDIFVAIQETGDDITLVISEDGKGLDYDAIHKKAVKQGSVKPEQDLSKADIAQLIFQSGVSTAKEVTDVSGRGVGMDVVKKAIDSAGGTIHIKSEKGQGSTFSIVLPKNVTTQITSGFLIKSGALVYVFPMEVIGETFAPEKKDYTTLKNRERVVKRRDRLFPVIDLGQALARKGVNKIADTTKKHEANVGVIVTVGSKEYVFCVDELLGVQKVVVKPVKGLGMNDNIFDGAAMMGDDSVAMILGPDGLKTLVEGS